MIDSVERIWSCVISPTILTVGLGYTAYIIIVCIPLTIKYLFSGLNLLGSFRKAWRVAFGIKPDPHN